MHDDGGARLATICFDKQCSVGSMLLQRDLHRDQGFLLALKIGNFLQVIRGGVDSDQRPSVTISIHLHLNP